MRTALFLMLAGLASAQQSVIINSQIVRCPGSGPSVLIFMGSAYQCQPLASFAQSLYAAAPPPSPSQPGPQFQTETISFAALASTATSITYSTAKPVIGGTVLWFYTTTGLDVGASAGAVAFTGQPLVISLPQGWSNADSVIIWYRSS